MNTQTIEFNPFDYGPTKEDLIKGCNNAIKYYSKQVENYKKIVSDYMNIVLNAWYDKKDYNAKDIINFITNKTYKLFDDYSNLFGYRKIYDLQGNIISSKQTKDYKKEFLFYVKKYYLCKKEVLDNKTLLNNIK